MAVPTVLNIGIRFTAYCEKNGIRLYTEDKMERILEEYHASLGFAEEYQAFLNYSDSTWGFDDDLVEWHSLATIN